ncbi:hypothetical protein PQ610_07050 [Tardisphaera miroshnichenkoae]
MSFTEKIIEEIKQNPELAEQLKKALDLVTQREILAELKTIAGYLNQVSEQQKKYSEEMVQLRDEQVKLREDFNAMMQEQKNMREELIKLSEEQVKLREDFNAMKEEMVQLRDEQVKLREDFNAMKEEMVQLRDEQVKLREDFNAMMQEQKNMREELIKLSEEQVKLREEQKSLREDFNAILLEVHDLRSSLVKTDQRLDSMFSGMIKGFGDLSKFAGISFEELMRRVMTAYLRKGGILPKGKSLKSAMIDSEQIDMYCDSPPIVGEVTASATSDEDARKLLRKAELVRIKTGKEPAKYLIILTATKDAYRKLVQICKENNVELVVGSISKEERSPA